MPLPSAAKRSVSKRTSGLRCILTTASPNTFARKDKYEKGLRLYHVDTEYVGSIEQEASEKLKVTTSGQGPAGDMNVGGQPEIGGDPVFPGSDVSSTGSEDSGDDEDGKKRRPKKNDKVDEEDPYEAI